MLFDRLIKFFIALAVAIAIIGSITVRAHAGDWGIVVFPEFEHQSHMTQHRPFTDEPTKFGAELIGLGLEIDYKALRLELVESYNLGPRQTVYNCPEYGDIVGPKENFSGRLSYRFRLL